jgi:hypothetical protein
MSTSLEKYKKFSLSDFTELYEKYHSDRSSHTKTTFRDGLKRVEKVYGKPLEELHMSYVLDGAEAMAEKMREKEYKNNTIISSITSVTKMLRMIDSPLKYLNDFLSMMNKLTREKYSDLEKQQKSESQEEQMMPFDEMKKVYLEKFDDYMSGEKKFNDFRNFMTLGFFLLEIPVRVQNYLKMKVKTGTENIEKLAKANNYLVINGEKMFFRWNNYKTKEKIGEKTYEIKDEKTKQLIKKYLDDYHPDGKKKQSRKDFLLNESMNPISQPDFSNGLKQITNKLYEKSFSVNAIRHSFITQLMANDPSLEQKIEILNTMGQTYKPQQVDYYKKIDKDEPERDSQGMKKKSDGEKV